MHTIVIGGGITGLSAAYDLVRVGQRTTLIEAQPSLGGVIQTEKVAGCVIEGGPDSFLTAKPAANELIRELGLADQLISSNDHSRITYIVRDRRLVAMPDGLMMMVPTRIVPVAVSPLLGWGTKLRMGLEYFRKPPVNPLPDRSVEAFIRDHYGQETVDYLAEPLLSGVYGGSVARLSARSVLGRFVDMETRCGSLTKATLDSRKNAPKPAGAPPPLFQSLKGGLGQLTGELIARIQGKADVIHSPAESIERSHDGFRVKVGGDWLRSESLILACPAWQSGELLRSIQPNLAGLLEAIDYSSSVTLALGYRREQCGAVPPGFGFLVPAKERKILVACTFVGAKFPHRVADSHIVLRCFLGGAGQSSVLDLSDHEIVSAVREELRGLLGWNAEPDFVRIRRWRRAMAQYEVGHTGRVAAIQEMARQVPGLHLAGNAYEGIGIPDCIRTGRAAARAAISSKFNAS